MYALKSPSTCSLVCDTMDELISMLDQDSITVTVSTRKIGKSVCLAWYLENVEGFQRCIVFDEAGVAFDRQGLHHKFDTDEAGVDEAYQLLDLLDQADRDGFDTIWIHSDFNMIGGSK